MGIFGLETGIKPSKVPGSVGLKGKAAGPGDGNRLKYASPCRGSLTSVTGLNLLSTAFDGSSHREYFFLRRNF